MKKLKILGNVLFGLTLIAPMFSFCLASELGESDIFGVLGIVRYSWIMLLFIPIGLLSFFIGLKLKNKKEKYKKNCIIAFICIPLLVIFGSYRFIFSNVVSYDVNKIYSIEDEIKLELPKNIKIASCNLDLYNLSYAKIMDEESKKIFETEIENNQLWQRKINYQIKSLLPLDVAYEISSFDSFVFYNITSNEYNTFPQNGEFESIFVAYDYDTQRLIIIDGYKNSII